MIELNTFFNNFMPGICLNIIMEKINFVMEFFVISIPMLWVYDHYKYCSFFIAGIVFIRQNLTSDSDV